MSPWTEQSLHLPKPIADYFSAETGNAENFSRCFAENAVVIDEGRTYTGGAEIKRWKAETSTKFTFESKPFKCESKDGKTIVTSHLTGNFPGSPVDLRYFFTLEGQKITSLEIVP